MHEFYHKLITPKLRGTIRYFKTTKISRMTENFVFGLKNKISKLNKNMVEGNIAAVWGCMTNSTKFQIHLFYNNLLPIPRMKFEKRR
jgi:hypothetical protein